MSIAALLNSTLTGVFSRRSSMVIGPYKDIVTVRLSMDNKTLTALFSVSILGFSVEGELLSLSARLEP